MSTANEFFDRLFAKHRISAAPPDLRNLETEVARLQAREIDLVSKLDQARAQVEALLQVQARLAEGWQQAQTQIRLAEDELAQARLVLLRLRDGAKVAAAVVAEQGQELPPF